MNALRQVGRPREPLLVGQRAYAVFAYSTHRKNQLDIAARIRVALPRVHRFLIEKGLHTPFTHDTPEHRQTVDQALKMYVSGAPIRGILGETGVVVSELYKALHNTGIPLRSTKKSRL